MNETIQSVMQTQLVFALQHVPLHEQITLKEYLDSLLVTFNKFRIEVEGNISQQDSYSFSIEYLNVLIYEFKNMYMYFEGSFDIAFYPDVYYDIGNNKPKRMRTIFDVHKYIILVTLSMLIALEGIIEKKIKYNLPLSNSNVKELSKYVLKPNMMINWIELSYLVYHTDIFNQRNGDQIQLVNWIKDLGLFAGHDISNVFQRIEEIKKRDKPFKYLDRLVQVAKTLRSEIIEA